MCKFNIYPGSRTLKEVEESVSSGFGFPVAAYPSSPQKFYGRRSATWIHNQATGLGTLNIDLSLINKFIFVYLKMTADFALTDPKLQNLLNKLHQSADAQDFGLSIFMVLRLIVTKLGLSRLLSADYFHSFMRDKYVALERDKAQF